MNRVIESAIVGIFPKHPNLSNTSFSFTYLNFKSYIDIMNVMLNGGEKFSALKFIGITCSLMVTHEVLRNPISNVRLRWNLTFHQTPFFAAQRRRFVHGI